MFFACKSTLAQLQRGESNMTKKQFLSTVLILMMVPFTASASIVTGGGTVNSGAVTFVELTPNVGPTLNVGNDNQQNANFYAFNESQNITLTVADAASFGLGVIGSDITVDSHYIFFDPKNNTLDGWVTFDQEIYALITDSVYLSASDILLQNSNVNYVSPNHSARGLEGADTAMIDGGNAYQLNVHFRTTSPGDYIRVLTLSPATVAEPSMIGLIGFGLVSLMALRRRAKK